MLINSQITAREVRLIDETGVQKGIVPTAQAFALADEKELDLVMISPTATPPVCKLMNYSKFRYEQIKKEKEERKNQKIVETKTLRLSMTIEKHDLEVIARKASAFLKSGNKVKTDILVRGRFNTMIDRGIEICNEFAKLVEEFGVVEKAAEKTGRNIFMILSPKKQEAKKEK